MTDDDGTYDGPAILEGLRRSRAAHNQGDREGAQRIAMFPHDPYEPEQEPNP